MANCSQCSVQIPDGQSICSMCMGDPNHGSDNYYNDWIEEQQRNEENERHQEEMDKIYK